MRLAAPGPVAQAIR